MKKQISRQAKLVTFKNSNKKGIKITFPFSKDDVAHVRILAGRKYHNDGSAKYWTCPLTIDNAEALHFWEFELDSKLLKFIGKSRVQTNTLQEIEVPNLKMKLFPFQKLGVSFIEARNGRALIGDEMGLGKTAQALAWLQLHPKRRPAIIVVPASLKLNWEREALMWMPNPNVQILNGQKDDLPITGDIIIINYDILPYWKNKLRNTQPQVLIVDEFHLIKNNRANRTKAIKILARHIPHVIGLSGTPIINRPREVDNIVRMIDNTILPPFWNCAHKFYGARHNGFGWDFNGATNIKEFHELLTSTVMLRRKKEDVLPELPPKIRTILPIELDNQKEYNRAETHFLKWLQENKGTEVAKRAQHIEALARIEALKQLTIKGKMKQAIKWIGNFLDTNGKLITFCTHIATVDKLMNTFNKIAVRVDGKVTGMKRDKAIQVFQSDNKMRLFVGNIKAAGIGINLTAAASVAFLELGWSPGEHDQAEGRPDRIGQKAQCINIYYLIAAGTIEERIAKLIDKKRKVTNQVLDGAETEDSSLLTELLYELQEKED